MKYTLVALIFSLLVSSLSVNLLYVDVLKKINEMDSTNDHKMGIIIKQVHELRNQTE